MLVIRYTTDEVEGTSNLTMKKLEHLTSFDWHLEWNHLIGTST